MEAQFWDERYGSRDQPFSGDPGGLLVSEFADLPPVQALDVGCGEGASVLWLARRGNLVTTPPPAAASDLICVHYFPCPRQPARRLGRAAPPAQGWRPTGDRSTVEGGAVPRPTSGPGAHAVGLAEAKGTLEFSGRRSDVSPSGGATGAWVLSRTAKEPS